MQPGFAKAHRQILFEEKVVWPWSRESPQNLGAFPEASDFKFGTQLGFAKTHHKITPRGKSGGGLWLGELPKILGSPIFLQRLGLATSNLARS